MFQDGIQMGHEDQRSEIMYFDLVEEGNMKIRYLNGRFGFISSLYDR